MFAYLYQQKQTKYIYNENTKHKKQNTKKLGYIRNIGNNSRVNAGYLWRRSNLCKLINMDKITAKAVRILLYIVPLYLAIRIILTQ